MDDVRSTSFSPCVRRTGRSPCYERKLVHGGNRRQLAKAGGPPDAAPVRTTLGQRLEDARRGRAVRLGWQGSEDLVGVLRQRLTHAAGRLVVLQVERHHSGR
jgi:hypothetical protein